MTFVKSFLFSAFKNQVHSSHLSHGRQVNKNMATLLDLTSVKFSFFTLLLPWAGKSHFTPLNDGVGDVKLWITPMCRAPIRCPVAHCDTPTKHFSLLFFFLDFDFASPVHQIPLGSSDSTVLRLATDMTSSALRQFLRASRRWGGSGLRICWYCLIL